MNEDETNHNFCEVLQRAQELEMIQKTKDAKDVEQRPNKTTQRDRVRFSYDEWEHDNVISASFSSSHGQVEETFEALQTSMGTVANRVDKLSATVATQGDATQQLTKSMNENFSQLTAVMTQIPAVMTSALAASMNDLKQCWWESLLVLAAADLGSSTGTSATTVTTKPKFSLRSKETIRSREYN